ncbi:MAG TPA: immunoglobulin domain-containing protein [Phycisphaerae bacterium]|nr:immunoglobulin domain-containing protein [Phycisphaerae bacterium]
MNRSKLPIIGLFIVLSSFQFPVPRLLAQCNGAWSLRTPAAKPSARSAHAMAYDSVRSVSVLFGGGSPAYNGETWEWNGANWSQKMPANAPSVRRLHAMAYDAARGVTVLFGGRISTGGTNAETWEWDGTNWTQRMPAVSPSGREEHTMAYDSARRVTVLFGGETDVGYNAETWEWDGTNWSQKSPATAPSGRARSAMAYDAARGVTVLFGGYTPTHDGETWEWDGTNWTQRLPAAAPSARSEHAIAYDSSRGVTVLFGGYTDAGRNGETWEWDGTNWSQRVVIPAPAVRYDHKMAFDTIRSVTVLFGGASDSTPAGGPDNETWEWAGPTPAISPQPVALTIAPGQPAAFSISASGLAPLSYRWRKDGIPLSDGGAIAGATTAALTINPAAESDSGSYTCVVTNPCGDTLSRAAALVVDPCIALDEVTDCNGNGRIDSCDIAADPALDANMNGTLESCESGCGMCGAGVPMTMPFAMIGVWAAQGRRRIRRPPIVPMGRSRLLPSHSSALMAIAFLVTSFQFHASSALAQCTGTWTPIMSASVPSARNNHAMAFDSLRGVTVLFGGDTAGGLSAETWEWDGSNWSRRLPENSPAPRGYHAMAYDSARDVTVLFGGDTGAIDVNNETWEWNGTNWTQQLPPASPSPRRRHALAYDSARGVTVLFGGRLDNGGSAETWEWDGTTWSLRSPAIAPSIRQYHAMAYDSFRNVTVLFGGDTGAASDETWEWDGTNWTRRMILGSPPARSDHALAYDSARQMIVLFGGWTGAVAGDTWEFDGSVWTMRSPAPAPSARDSHRLAYDSIRGMTVLFGGFTNNYNGETWEWTGPEPAILQHPANQTVAPGQSAVFSVNATGPGTLSYFWGKDGAQLADGNGISGTNTANLTISSATADHVGVYTCIVVNSCGNTRSRDATLVVDPCKPIDANGDCNGNGVLDSCDLVADPALDANSNGTPDSCEPPPDAACGACGAGVPLMMPLALFALYATTRRRANHGRLPTPGSARLPSRAPINRKIITPVVLLISSFQFPASSSLAQCTGAWSRLRTAAPRPRRLLRRRMPMTMPLALLGLVTFRRRRTS